MLLVLIAVACAAGSQLSNGRSFGAHDPVPVAGAASPPRGAPSNVPAAATLVASVTEASPRPSRRSQSPIGWSREQGWAYYNRLRNDPYALDVVPRWLSAEQAKPRCQPERMVSYAGELMPFSAAVRIRPEFADRLSRFEHIVSELAHEIYGRAPVRIRHLGAYVCRTSRFRSRRISEHALGNAIDISGFDFASVPKGQLVDLAEALRRPLRVRVQKHWNASDDGPNAVHRRFLRELTQRLVDAGVFRVALGPSHRGHSNHFHFDMSPWRYVNL